MKKNVVKSITLYDDINVNYEDYREEFADYMEDDTILNSGDRDSELYDYVYRQLNFDWEELIDALSKSGECVIVGSVGRWNGRFEITPTKCENLSVAVNKCVSGCDYVRVTLTNGHLEVVGVHHDANNYFEIYLLNKLGCNTYGADLNKECYYMKITKIPNFL